MCLECVSYLETWRGELSCWSGSSGDIPQTTACTLREASRLGVLDCIEKSLMVNSHQEQSAAPAAGGLWGVVGGDECAWLENYVKVRHRSTSRLTLTVGDL